MVKISGLKSNKPKEPCTPRRILIVDDEKGILHIFLHVVSSSIPNCRVDVAVNGAEAVEEFQEAHHSVLVMDIKMPVMDGATAFRKIQEICEKQSWEMPAFIFCTGYAPSAAITGIVTGGSRHCLLLKPVSIWQLIEELEARLPIKAARKTVEFSIEAPQAKWVGVAGTFNDWQAVETPMEKGPAGVWRVQVELPVGHYEYRLVVDKAWICDPKAGATVPNPYGGENSVLNVC